MGIIRNIIGTLLALIIWESFLSGVCSRIRHNYWLNSKISNFYGKIGREFLHRLFRINKLKGRGHSLSLNEFVEGFWQISFEKRLNGEQIPVDISIKIQGEKRVFERVCRIEVTPKGYESVNYNMEITTLDSNGVDKQTIPLDISRKEKKQLASQMYGKFVLYHKQE